MEIPTRYDQAYIIFQALLPAKLTCSLKKQGLEDVFPIEIVRFLREFVGFRGCSFLR